jgi:predicted phosphodiesterase
LAIADAPEIGIPFDTDLISAIGGGVRRNVGSWDMIHGLLSDAHGNVEAFEQAARLLERLGAERLIFLGDAVGYLPGAAVARRIRELAMPAVRGNHEAMLLDGDTCEARESIYRLQATRRQMPDALLHHIATWPTIATWRGACGPAMAVHGSPADPINGYVYPDTDLSPFQVAAGTTVFMGHTHRPFDRQFNGVRYVNVGSCGLPRDAGRLGSAVLFDDVSGQVRIVRFDITDATARAVARVGYLHQTVLEVFRRPAPPDLVGELHDA